ncbi:cation transporter [Spiroplasma endosymbiont of Panorpa germanica]|uniref:cation transporter n=1 Tax=Spiroplasma endosymbiont of Panorpa germanica TaxID=3066314 RepID=UPI0030CD7564
MNITAKIKNMNCQHCVDKITKSLKKTLKIKKIALDLETEALNCVVKDQMQLEELKILIEELGYQIQEIKIEN